MHKIFIVEDHPVVRQGYIALIGREKDMQVCGEAESVPDALEKIPQANPDLVVIDISLGETNGIDLLQELQQRQPQLPTLIISGHDEQIYRKAVFRLGAKGYLTKENPQDFVTTIRSVLEADAASPKTA